MYSCSVRVRFSSQTDQRADSSRVLRWENWLFKTCEGKSKVVHPELHEIVMSLCILQVLFRSQTMWSTSFLLAEALGECILFGKHSASFSLISVWQSFYSSSASERSVNMWLKWKYDWGKQKRSLLSISPVSQKKIISICLFQAGLHEQEFYLHLAFHCWQEMFLH